MVTVTVRPWTVGIAVDSLPPNGRHEIDRSVLSGVKAGSRPRRLSIRPGLVRRINGRRQMTAPAQAWKRDRPMANYVLVYHGGAMPESPEEGAMVMKAWTDWFTTLGDAVVDGGNPASATKTIAPDGSVSDDPAGPSATRSSRPIHSTRPSRWPRAARSSRAAHPSRSWRRSRRCDGAARGRVRSRASSAGVTIASGGGPHGPRVACRPLKTSESASAAARPRGRAHGRPSRPHPTCP